MLLGVLITPFTLTLSLLTTLLIFLFSVYTILLAVTSIVLTILNITLFFAPAPVNKVMFLFLTFLLSPCKLRTTTNSLL